MRVRLVDQLRTSKLQHANMETHKMTTTKKQQIAAIIAAETGDDIARVQRRLALASPAQMREIERVFDALVRVESSN